MKEVVAIRHVAFEHLGTLAPLLSGRGFRIRYLDAGVADLQSFDPLSPALLVTSCFSLLCPNLNPKLTGNYQGMCPNY